MVGHGIAPLLLAMVGGYWVIERAEREKGQVRQLGRFLGSVIIVVSLFGVICQVWSSITCSMGKSGRGGYCPFSSKMLPPPPPPSK